MKRCSRCLMPSSRPGIRFVGDVCLGCLNHTAQQQVDWDERLQELKSLVKGKKVGVAVSGGKDSYYLTHLATKVLGLAPTLIRVGDWFGAWPPHEYNLDNLQHAFRCQLVEWKVDANSFREMCRAGFEQTGNLGFYDTLIYAGAMGMAQRMGCDYVLFGEDSAYQYGTTITERATVDEKSFGDMIVWMWGFLDSRSQDVLRGPKPDGIYASYYTPWSGYQNYLLAKQYGFRGMDGRKGFYESYTALDGLGWGVSCHWKFLKYGFGRVTDEVTWALRDGRITMEQAHNALKGDGLLDSRVRRDFLRVTGYTMAEYEELEANIGKRT